MSQTTYKFERSDNAQGIAYEFSGPGMPQYANSVMFFQALNDAAAVNAATDKSRGWEYKDSSGKEQTWSEHQSEDNAMRMGQFLNIAFEAGRESLRREIRELIKCTVHR